MARPILVSTLVIAAFGVGFGARHAASLRNSDAPAAPSLSADETIDPTEAERQGAPRPKALIGAVAPASPPVQASVTTPATARGGSTNAVQLAYAPVLPEPPAPFANLIPPPDLPLVAPPAIAPKPVAAPEQTPQPPKLASFPAADVDVMRDVIAQMRKGDIAAADAAIKKLTDPTARALGEWVLIRSGQRAVGFPRILAFMEKETAWPTQHLLQRRAEEALSAEGRPTATVRAFFANRKPLTVAGRIVLARALLSDNKRDEAAALIRTVWRDDNFSDETETRLLSEFGDLIRREDHRARMERYVFKEEMAKALRSANRAGPEYAALVRARQAVESKAKNAKALVDAVPATLRSDTSYVFARAQLARRSDQAAEAAKAMEGVTRDADILVDGDEWWVERRLIARKLLDAGDAKLAYAVAANHGAESDAMRVEAEFHAGWIALRFLKDAKLAATHFAKAGENAQMPMSVSRVAYWQGRAAEAMKDEAAAQAFYEKAASHSGFFYGQLARAKLPAGVDINLTTGSVDAGDRKTLENDRALRAIDLLLTLNERDIAITIVHDLAVRSGTPTQIDALGDMLASRRDARAALMMGKLAMQRGVAFDRHAFPTFGIPSYQSLTEIVETPIVHAIARQESAFDPKAVSHAGARGLMQLMPATARVTAQRFKAPFDVGRLTSDASYNAQIGSAHLGDLLNEWRGSYILVFAAYNAGSHNVKKWIDAYGDPRNPDIDPIDWIERIPFTETRNYVQRVMENLQMYRARLTPNAPFTIEADLKRNSVPAPARPTAIAGDPPLAR